MVDGTGNPSAIWTYNTHFKTDFGTSPRGLNACYVDARTGAQGKKMNKKVKKN